MYVLELQACMPGKTPWYEKHGMSPPDGPTARAKPGNTLCAEALFDGLGPGPGLGLAPFL